MKRRRIAKTRVKKTIYQGSGRFTTFGKTRIGALRAADMANKVRHVSIDSIKVRKIKV